MLKKYGSMTIAVWFITVFCTYHAEADWFIRFDESDFTVTDDFNDLQTFSILIRLEGDPIAGVYDNPNLVGVDYSVAGLLPNLTPSGFSGFQLNRPETAGEMISGAEFYAQGSSLNFEIAAGVDISDGIQFSELTGTLDPFFVFDAREVGNGRYHPPIVILNSDGTGVFENSNNVGGINPTTGNEVSVDYGEEYKSFLAFDPTTFTLGAVPEPSSLMILGLGMGGFFLRRKRN